MHLIEIYNKLYWLHYVAARLIPSNLILYRDVRNFNNIFYLRHVENFCMVCNLSPSKFIYPNLSNTCPPGRLLTAHMRNQKLESTLRAASILLPAQLLRIGMVRKHVGLCLYNLRIVHNFLPHLNTDLK